MAKSLRSRLGDAGRAVRTALTEGPDASDDDREPQVSNRAITPKRETLRDAVGRIGTPDDIVPGNLGPDAAPGLAVRSPAFTSDLKAREAKPKSSPALYGMDVDKGGKIQKPIPTRRKLGGSR